jgi:hypothetical protein
VLTKLAHMGTKKPRPDDRHKPSRMVRIPEAMAAALEEVAAEQFNTLTEQVKVGLREYLERMGRLPKPPGRPKP